MIPKLSIPTLCFHSVELSAGSSIYAMNAGKFDELLSEPSDRYPIQQVFLNFIQKLNPNFGSMPKNGLTTNLNN